MRFNQFYYDFGGYHEFSLIHYLSAKSFLVCNPEAELVIHTNGRFQPVSYWFNQLAREFPDRFINQPEVFPDEQLNKYDCINHFVDEMKLRSALKGEWSVDSDFICLKSLIELEGNDPVISEERDPLSHHYEQLAIGILYFPKDHEFGVEWLKQYQNYEKGKGWTYWSGVVPNELYQSGKYLIKVLPESSVDPYTYTRDKLADLFLHNYTIRDAYMIHTAESIAWDRYLKPLDVEHIMTVDTTFTKAVRRFVTNLWDEDSHHQIW